MAHPHHAGCAGKAELVLAQHGRRACPDVLPPIEYPEHFEVRKVSTNGGIRWHSRWINISSALGNEFIGLEPIGPALWQIYFGSTTLGWFDEELFVIFDTHGNTGRNPIC